MRSHATHCLLFYICERSGLVSDLERNDIEIMLDDVGMVYDGADGNGYI